MNTFTVPRASWPRRLGWKILPPTRLNISMPHPLPDGFKDAIVVNVGINLSFKDRLRVLFFGHLTVHSITLTEHPPGNCDTQSGVSTV